MIDPRYANQPEQSIPFFDEFTIVQEKMVMKSTKSPYAIFAFSLFNVSMFLSGPTQTIGVAVCQLTLTCGDHPVSVNFAVDTAIFDDMTAALTVPPRLPFGCCNEPNFAEMDEAFEREFAKQEKPRPEDDRTDVSGYDRTAPRRD